MRILNPNNLPQSLVNACSVNEHSKEGCVSATELIRGTKQLLLEHRHWGELEEKVDNRIWALFGTAVHRLLEEKNPNAFTEERFEVKVGSKTVTGQVDLYDLNEKTITDYKTASVWKVIHGDFDDWRKQGLIYAYLMKQSGLEIKKCRFLAIMRDWASGEAKRKPDYPQSQVYVYEFDVSDKDLEEIKAFIEAKVADIEANENKSDDEIPECSAKERWASKDTFAVKKQGRKTAVKVFDDKAEAEAMAADIEGGYVEERKGTSARCERYCSCCSWCKFYKENCQGEEENGESAA